MPDTPTPPTSPDDPLGRLSRLRPAVDLDAAVEAFGRVRRRRARRHRALAAVTAVAVVLGGGALLAALRDDRAPTVVAGPPSTAEVDVPGTTVESAGTGVVLEVEVPTGGRVGGRVELLVRIRNTTEAAVAIEAAGECDAPVAVGVRPVGSDIAPGTEVASGDLGDGWDGDLATLPGRLRDQQGPRPLAGRTIGNEWARYLACPGIVPQPTVVAPGAALERQMTVDLRWGPGALPTDVELVVTTGAVEGDPIVATVPFDLVDDPARLGTLDAALGDLPSAPTLAEWLETSDLPQLDQRWHPDLTWWDGAWVLWIDPLYADGNVTGPIRVTWDADRGEVVDVRTVQLGNGASADDPGAPEGYPSDEVRFSAG